MPALSDAEIVSVLRARANAVSNRKRAVYSEAADEIERLRAALAEVPGNMAFVPNLVAVHVMHHIREMYPAMFAAVPKTAQTSVRNCIELQCERLIKAALV